MTTAAPNYLDPRTLATLAGLDVRARMVVEGLMTGMHRSPYQGFSVEFAQHRQYAPGDDTRFLDWKVYAKTDKLYLKQYQKETNLDLLLLLDHSPSMGYRSSELRVTSSELRKGSRNAKLATRNSQLATPPAWRKYDHAATVAAALAYLALQQQDRVGLILFGEQAVTATRMSNNLGHWRAIVDAMATGITASEPPRVAANQKPTSAPESPSALRVGQTDFAALFDTIAARLTQRSLIVLISDLFGDPSDLERGLAKLHHRRHDVMVLQTLDAAELTFPFRAPSDFVGLEAEGRLPLDPPALRKHYLDVLNEHLRQVEAMTRRFHFDYLLMNTSEPIGPPLSHFLARRSASLK